MSTLTRPPPRSAPRPAAGDRQPPKTRRGALSGVAGLLACLALLAASVLPLRFVLEGGQWGRLIAGTVLVAVGLVWGARQVGAPAPAALLLAAAGWAVFVATVFAPHTVALGLLPTFETYHALRALSSVTAELVMLQVPPAPGEPPFTLPAVSGVWLVSALAAQALLYRGAVFRAIFLALTMFTVPLLLAPSRTSATFAVVAFLAASAACLLLLGRSDLRGWAHAATPASEEARPRALFGAVSVAAVAIAAGVALADALPGAGEPPLYELRGRGGTTVTTNPMVGLRPSLTAQDTGAVLHVASPRPVYLRTTALDLYDGEMERWTTERITGSAITGGRIPSEIDGAITTEHISVGVEVANLSGVLVPSPYPAVEVGGPTADSFQYDLRNGTLTMASGEELGPGDEYTVTAALPPESAHLERLEGFAPESHLTALPDNVPAEVGELAAEIVAEAEASTPFDMVLAIQDELRSWTYSLEPEQGHDGEAMLTFLENRVGYCEQFAGTMAVMLRSLDIPARVAVGFGPGELADTGADRWDVSNANAHAWVEVLFAGHGWVAFEPTPRTDGNVLVPSAATLIPSDTAGEHQASAGEAGSDLPDGDLLPDWDDDALGLDMPGGDLPDGAADDGALGAGAGGRSGWWTGGLLALVAAAGLLGVPSARRSRRARTGGPRVRVALARQRVERLGHGLGLHPAASETDAEYLSKVGARLGCEEAARTLAAESARARYATATSEEAAARAEQASASIERAVPSAWRRARLRARGLALRGLRALPRRGGYELPSPRSRLSRM